MCLILIGTQDSESACRFALVVFCIPIPKCVCFQLLLRLVADQLLRQRRPPFLDSGGNSLVADDINSLGVHSRSTSHHSSAAGLHLIANQEVGLAGARASTCSGKATSSTVQSTSTSVAESRGDAVGESPSHLHTHRFLKHSITDLNESFTRDSPKCMLLKHLHDLLGPAQRHNSPFL